MASSSRRTIDRSIGTPTERLLMIVESNDTSAHFTASRSEVRRRTTRSMIGLPYLLSPSWKYGVSSLVSMLPPDDLDAGESSARRPAVGAGEARDRGAPLASDELGHFDHRRGAEPGRLAAAGLAGRRLAAQVADHRLRGGEIARIEQH